MDATSTDTLFAVEEGQGNDAPIVLLHGFGAGAHVWANVQKALAGEIRTLAYDLPGHGRSINCTGFERSGKMAGAVTEDLAGRGIGKVHLVGHSMGGAVATLIALRTPALVASMTLLAPGGYGPEINHRLLRRYAGATTHHEMLGALENMFGWNAEIPAPMVEALVESRNIPNCVDKLKIILDKMLRQEGADLVQGTFWRGELAELQMPVKVLWGTQDRVLPTRQAHRLPPMFAAHVFENTGHMLIDERGEDVVSLVRQNIRAATG
ncbi:alpha/beta fold hydrolase [Hoeflea sp. TYP-13]|uniref:alpha/beta fold hydrolase n=1 Tax=Hoeflea sp. TYP-13 TaxID=3230023 RepID=UPI0034C682C8